MHTLWVSACRLGPACGRQRCEPFKKNHKLWCLAAPHHAWVLHECIAWWYRSPCLLAHLTQVMVKTRTQPQRPNPSPHRRPHLAGRRSSASGLRAAAAVSARDHWRVGERARAREQACPAEACIGARKECISCAGKPDT